MIPWGIPCQMMVGNFINIFKTHINFIRNGMNNDKCKDIEYMFIFSTLENYITEQFHKDENPKYPY